MRESGFAILGTAVVIALAVALGFGAFVVLEQSNLVATTKQAQNRLSAKSHERVNVLAVGRNPENTKVLVRNDGSTSALLEKVLVVNVDNSLKTYDLGGEFVGVLDNSVFTVTSHVASSATLGVLTRLGNTFWED